MQCVDVRRRVALSYMGAKPNGTMKLSLTRLPLVLLLVAAGATACTAATDEGAQGDEEDLTSLTARSRKLDFIGTVYVDANASDSVILSAVKQQTQSAFGALRTASGGV